MARAIDWALQRDRADGADFLAINAGSNSWNYQVKDLAKAVAKVVPGVEISINTNAPPDKRSYRVDFALFEKLAPAYQPQVDLSTAITELKTGLEAMGFKDPNFRSSKYMRLEILRQLEAHGLLGKNLEWTSKPRTGTVPDERILVRQ
jgi:hypothetical protein